MSCRLRRTRRGGVSIFDGEDGGIPAGEVFGFGFGIAFGAIVFGPGGIVGTDEGHVEVGGDLVFETDGPDAAVGEGAAEAFIEEIVRGAVGGGEDAAFGLAIGGGVGADPDARDGFFIGIGGVIGAHPLEGLGHGENGGGLKRFGEVAAAGRVHFVDTDEGGVVFIFRDDIQAGAGHVVFTVVTGPVFAENLATEAAFVGFVFGSLGVFVEGAVRGNFEGVGGGAEPDDGTAAVEVVDEVLHLLVGPVLEAGVDDHEIGVIEDFNAGDVGVTGIDVAVLVNAEEDRAFEAVMFREDARESGEGFFGAVFVVVGDEDDVFAGAEAFFGAFEDEGVGLEESGGEEESEEGGFVHGRENGVVGSELSVRWAAGNRKGRRKIKKS